MLQHLVKVAHSVLREHAKRGGALVGKLLGEGPRSSKWPGVEHAFLRGHSSCAACAGKLRLQVHHKQPFHLHPELELDPSNLMTLCMGPNECHIRIGHGDDFKMYNPNVIVDAAESLAKPDLRPSIAARAKANRLG